MHRNIWFLHVILGTLARDVGLPQSSQPHDLLSDHGEIRAVEREIWEKLATLKEAARARRASLDAVDEIILAQQKAVQDFGYILRGQRVGEDHEEGETSTTEVAGGIHDTETSQPKLPLSSAIETLNDLIVDEMEVEFSAELLNDENLDPKDGEEDRQTARRFVSRDLLDHLASIFSSRHPVGDTVTAEMSNDVVRKDEEIMKGLIALLEVLTPNVLAYRFNEGNLEIHSLADAENIADDLLQAVNEVIGENGLKIVEQTLARRVWLPTRVFLIGFTLRAFQIAVAPVAALVPIFGPAFLETWNNVTQRYWGNINLPIQPAPSVATGGFPGVTGNLNPNGQAAGIGDPAAMNPPTNSGPQNPLLSDFNDVPIIQHFLTHSPLFSNQSAALSSILRRYPGLRPNMPRIGARFGMGSDTTEGDEDRQLEPAPGGDKYGMDLLTGPGPTYSGGKAPGEVASKYKIPAVDVINPSPSMTATIPFLSANHMLPKTPQVVQNNNPLWAAPWWMPGSRLLNSRHKEPQVIVVPPIPYYPPKTPFDGYQIIEVPPPPKPGFKGPVATFLKRANAWDGHYHHHHDNNGPILPTTVIIDGRPVVVTTPFTKGHGLLGKLLAKMPFDMPFLDSNEGIKKLLSKTPLVAYRQFQAKNLLESIVYDRGDLREESEDEDDRDLDAWPRDGSVMEPLVSLPLVEGIAKAVGRMSLVGFDVAAQIREALPLVDRFLDPLIYREDELVEEPDYESLFDFM